MVRRAKVTVPWVGSLSNQKVEYKWQDSAKCNGMDTELFFEPEPEDFDSVHDWSQAVRTKMSSARRLCVGCPVIDECLNANMDTEAGVFGGLSFKQRENLARSTEGTWIRPSDGRKGNGSKRLIDADTVSMLLKYKEEGMSYGEISTITGMNKGTVHRVLNDPTYNTSARPLAESTASALRFQKNWNEPKYKAVRELIADGRLTAKDVGEVTGFSAKTVRRVKYSMDKETQS